MHCLLSISSPDIHTLTLYCTKFMLFIDKPTVLISFSFQLLIKMLLKLHADFKKKKFKNYMRDFTVVQWLRLWVPNAGGLSLIPGQATRCHMPQLRPSAAKLKKKKKSQKSTPKKAAIYSFIFKKWLHFTFLTKNLSPFMFFISFKSPQSVTL